MKRLLISTGVLSCLLFSSCQKESVSAERPTNVPPQSQTRAAGSILKDQYIVQLKPEFLSHSLIGMGSYDAKINAAVLKINTLLNALPAKETIKLQHVYVAAINGFAAKLSAAQVEVLRTLPAVKLIEQDVVGQIVGIQSQTQSASTTSTQTIEYGVIRTGYGDGTGKRAFIIDSGIDLDHEDLNVNTALGKDFTADGGLFGGGGGGLFGGGGGLFGGGGGTPAPQGNDDNGHGTHCAGIVAAKNNNVGVVGVAANAEVVAIKVLNFAGNGNASDVLQGIDYVASVGKAGDVANLSLTFLSTQQSINTGVVNLGQKGIFVTIAAGNDSANSNNYSPAKANGTNVFTVSAIGLNDQFASFSNFANPPIDYASPGVDIKSTYTNNGYSVLSGTSMAAPHLAGLLLLTNGNLNTSGNAVNDPDGIPDPIAHL